MHLDREALRAKIARQKRSALRLPRRLTHAAHVAVQVLYWTATFQLRAEMRRKRELRLIRNSDLFDRHHYLAQCAGAPDAERDPVRHYILVGAGRGLDPSPLFDSSAYAERNPDATARGENPLAHFIRSRAAARTDAPAHATLRSTSVQGAPPWRVQPFRPASGMRSVLVVHSRLPRPARDDRVLAILELLREMGYAVTFLCPEPASAAQGDSLGRLGIAVQRGFEASVAHLAAEGHAHDLVLLAGAEAAFRLLAPIRAYATEATVIHDRAALFPPEGDAALDHGAGERAAVLARMDDVTSRCADVVWVPSEALREALLRDVPDARVDVVAGGGHPSPAPERSALERGLAAARAPSVAPAGREPPTASPEPAREPVRAGRLRGSVLVAGVYLGDVENNAIEIARELGRAEEWNVEQRWIALGKSPPAQPLAAITAWQQRSRVAKFVLMNRLLAKLELERYDYVFVCDDDIRLPERFVDRYLELVVRHDLALAQPARTHDSYTDNWIVERLDGLTARRTRFVEIGPLFSMRKDAVRLLTPFDETSPMGWALDFNWPIVVEGAGLRMGIVDATPVAHDMRKPVALYDNRDAAIAMQAFLSKRPHLSKHDAFSILEAYA